MKRLSYYSIIGRNPSLLNWHLTNVVKNAGLDRSDYDLNIVIYRNRKIPKNITDAIIDICYSFKSNYAFYDEPHDNFLHNLYACWNLGYKMGSAPYVLRGGSDQAFSPNTFRYMLEAAEANTDTNPILQMHTIEDIKAGPGSRHWIKDWGTWDKFDEDAFYKFSEKNGRPGLYTAEECLKIWGHPTNFTSSLGPNTCRTDGVSWLCTRELFNLIGPMQPINYQGVTGDVTFHDKAQLLGIKNYMVGNAFSWHAVKGESAGITQ